MRPLKKQGEGNQAVDLVLSPKLEKFEESIPAILQNCGNFLFVAIEESDRMCLFTVDEQVVEWLHFHDYANQMRKKGACDPSDRMPYQ